jgi:hypothetical protein
LWSVHLNDQNGLKIRPGQVVRRGESAHGVQPGSRAGSIRLSEDEALHRPGREGDAHAKGRGGDEASGEQPKIFLALVEKVRTFDRSLEKQFIDARDYEGLGWRTSRT